MELTIKKQYKALEQQLDNRKDELVNEYIQSNESRKDYISSRLDFLDGIIDGFYEAFSLWSSDLVDDDYILTIVKDTQSLLLGV